MAGLTRALGTETYDDPRFAGAGQMPLNNNGDDIELLLANGQVVDNVSYVVGQVSPEREIRFRP